MLLGVLLTLSGCFKEDFSFCPLDVNVNIRYALPDGNGGYTFMQDITTVTTAVFDDEGALVQTITTNTPDHRIFQGIRIKLAPGNYRLISWGNSDENTVLNNIPNCYTTANSIISYNNIVNGHVGNCDPVYYAPNTVRTARAGNLDGEFVFTVKQNESYDGLLNFRNAHRRVEVFVKGYDVDGVTTPNIELTGLPASLTFLGMNSIVGGNLVSAELQSYLTFVNENGKSTPYAMAPFTVFYFLARYYDIGINIINPKTGEIIYSTKLNDHINPYVDNPDKIVLQLVLEFKNGTVEITIPSWGADDVDYGIFE